jgi:hypothetical protein
MPRRSFADHSAAWRRLYLSLEEAITGFPTLAPFRDELNEVVEEVYRRKSRVLQLQSQLSQEAALLRDAMERGKELESRLRSGLKSALGPHSRKLEHYGIKSVKRKRAVPAGDGAGPAPEEPPGVEPAADADAAPAGES